MLYLAMDYSAASVPGVFFFDAGVFYLEGVVEPRADTVPAAPMLTLVPSGIDRPVEPDRPAARIVAATRPMPGALRSRVAFTGAPPPSDGRSEDH